MNKKQLKKLEADWSSPACVTRLFRGSANLSVQTMVKLAQAAGGSLRVDLAEQVDESGPLA